MTAKNKLPPIRFKGFHEEWEDSGFSVTFTNIPNNTLSRDELNYNFGFAKNIHYGDVLIKFKELLDIQKEEIPFISNSDYVNKLKSSKLQNGDIVIADAAEDEIVGKCTEITNIEKDTVLSGLHTIAVRPTQPFASKYLGYYMNSSSYHNQLLPLLQGTKVLSISKSAIKKTMISYPKDSLEQTKIGNYFQNLDKLIEQKEKKYQKLKQLKKAMLEKMFPKEGATTPEIRFKGFSEEWEKKEFKDNIVSVQTGTNLLGSTINKGTSLIKMGNIQRGYFSFEKVEYLNEKVEVEVENIANYGDFLFNTRNTLELVGKGATWMKENGKFAFNNNIARFIFKGIDTIFFNYLYNTKNMIKQVQTRAMGTTSVAAIYPKNLNSIEYYLPNIDEQTKIGNYFQKLDHLIDLQNQELQKLKNIKKASLAKMFV